MSVENNFLEEVALELIPGNVLVLLARARA